MRLGFEGKRIAVTGTAGGLGGAVCKALAEEGAQVLGADLAGAWDAAEDGLAERHACDLRQTGDIAAFARAAGPRLDGLIHCAGFLRRDGEMDDDALRTAMVETNLTAALTLVEALLPALRAVSGSAVLVSSTTALRPVEGLLWYGALKAGIAQATRSLALREARHGVRVNAVAPGGFRSPMTRATWSDPDKLAAWEAEIPLGRYPSVEEVVPPILMLASPVCGHVTGVVIPVDGGYSLGGPPAGGASA